VLRWVGLWWGAQLVFAGLVVVWALAGFAVLAPKAAALPDRFAVACTSVALGLAMHLAFAFLAFHRGLVRFLGLADLRAAALLALVPLAAIAALGARRLRPGLEPRRWCVSPASALALFAGASLVALGSAYGYRDGRAGPENQLAARVEAGRPWGTGEAVPEWGSSQDRHRQLFEGGVALRGFPRGFPRGVFEHRGVETTLTAVGYLVGPFDDDGWMAVSKPLNLLWLFLAAYGLYALAREWAGEAAACAAGLGALFFAAIDPLLLAGLPASSYRVFPASGTLYHNVTQQASLAFGFVGLASCVRALRSGAGVYAPGCALLVASLFCKPSFFLVAGPLVLGAGLLARAALPRTQLVRGGAWLAGGVGAWLAYPRVFGLPSMGMPLEPGFFAWQRNTSVLWPLVVESTPALLVLVVTLAFAAFLLPLADALRRPPRWDAGARLVGAIALAGVLFGVLLVERGSKAGQGNVMWTAACGLLVALPLLVRGIERIGSRSVRRAAWVVYAAHLLSGLWNLGLFGYLGRF
jgi:hypothetical protein